jgi:hypothetical protein
VALPSSTLTKTRVLWLLLVAAVSCGGLRASTVPLGGKHEVEEAPLARASASAAPGSAPVVASASAPSADEGQADAEEAPVVASDRSTKTDAAPAPKVAAGAFQPKLYSAGQKWTRLFDLEATLKVGPGGAMDMRVVSHQEARFEVLKATSGTIDKLHIEYTTYVSKMTVMGSTQETPEDVSGKSYVITFPGGKPDVKSSSGATPPKKELEAVNDDAREPLEAVIALKELAQLAAKGKGDFSSAGATALAGGEDEDTKIAGARASLQKLGANQSATLDLAYTMTNTADEGTTIETRLSGTVVVLDAPARYQSFTLSGPLELRSNGGEGMSGSGTTRLTLSYKY